MASLPLVALTVLLLVTLCSSNSLYLGTTVNAQLAFTEDVKLFAFPLKTRTKNVFYSGDRVIKGISAVDHDNSTAKVIITSGGVGSIFTNVRLKSNRGDGLNYRVQVFV